MGGRDAACVSTSVTVQYGQSGVMATTKHDPSTTYQDRTEQNRLNGQNRTRQEERTEVIYTYIVAAMVDHDEQPHIIQSRGHIRMTSIELKDSELAHREDTVECGCLLESRVAQREVRHLGRVCVRGRVDDRQLNK